MPSVKELSAPYENVMLGPRRGPDVPHLLNFTAGYDQCYACAYGQPVLDAVIPISYSVAREQLHHALASYKRLDGDVPGASARSWPRSCGGSWPSTSAAWRKPPAPSIRPGRHRPLRGPGSR